MNLHEYQSKQLFERAGIPIPKGITVEQLSEVAYAASEIDSDGCSDHRSQEWGQV
jgi:succinyl-CoA synthetase beta subunit